MFIADASGFIPPTAPVSNLQYQAAIEPSYKPSQQGKKLRNKSSKPVSFEDDDELPTELPEGDEDDDDFQHKIAIQQVIVTNLFVV